MWHNSRVLLYYQISCSIHENGTVVNPFQQRVTWEPYVYLDFEGFTLLHCFVDASLEEYQMTCLSKRNPESQIFRALKLG